MPLVRGSPAGTVTTSGTISSGTLNVRPESESANYASTAALSANTAVQVFSAASNTNGCILLSADMSTASNAMIMLITKATAPSSITDGSVLVGTRVTAGVYPSGQLPKEQYIAAGQGLYFIANAAVGADAFTYRACRYKLL